MASEKVQTLTDANFEQTVNQPTARSSWTSGRNGAAPAGVLRPTVDELAGDYDGRVVVAR